MLARSVASLVPPRSLLVGASPSLETLIVTGVSLSKSLTFSPDISLRRMLARSVLPLVPPRSSLVGASPSWLGTSPRLSSSLDRLSSSRLSHSSVQQGNALLTTREDPGESLSLRPVLISGTRGAECNPSKAPMKSPPGMLFSSHRPLFFRE